MTDFFAQLAARYRGEADTLRPRVPFRFEPVSPSLATAALTGPAAAEAGPGQPWPGGRRGSRRAFLAGDVPTADALTADALTADPAAADPHRAGPGADPAGTRTGGRGGTRHGSGPVPDTPVAARLAPGARRARQDPAATGPARSPAGPPGHAVPGGALLPGQYALPTGAAAVLSETAAAGSGSAAAGSGSAAGERGTADPGPELAVLRPRTAPGRAPQRAATEPKAASDAVTRTADDPGEPAGPGRDTRRRPPGRAGREPAVLAPEAGRRQTRGYIAAEPSGPARESITVQVTIGRVEVRADTPAATPRAKERPAAGPSLADYLRDRSRSAGAAS